MVTHKRKNVGLRLPEPLNQTLADEARNMGISKNSLMLQVLWEHYEGREKDAKHA